MSPRAPSTRDILEGLSHLGDVVYALLSCAGGSQRCSRSPQPYPSTLLPRPRRSPDLVPSGIPSRHLSDVLRTLALCPGDFDESPHRDVRLQRHQPAPPLRPLVRSGLYDGLREAVALRGVFDAYPGMSNACSIASEMRFACRSDQNRKSSGSRPSSPAGESGLHDWGMRDGSLSRQSGTMCIRLRRTLSYVSSRGLSTAQGREGQPSGMHVEPRNDAHRQLRRVRRGS